MNAFIFFQFFVLIQIAKPSNGADDIETVLDEDEDQFDYNKVAWATGFDSSNVSVIKLHLI